MKKLITMTVAIVIIAMAGVAMAGDSATVDVSATVVGTCKFNSGGTISFTLDPSVGGDVNGTVTQPTFWCTKNAGYTISDNDGMYKSGTIHQLKHGTFNEYISYSFAYTASGSGQGKSSPITMNISSTIVAADYIDASAGDYSDTVTLTITP